MTGGSFRDVWVTGAVLDLGLSRDRQAHVVTDMPEPEPEPDPLGDPEAWHEVHTLTDEDLTRLGWVRPQGSVWSWTNASTPRKTRQ